MATRVQRGSANPSPRQTNRPGRGNPLGTTPATRSASPRGRVCPRASGTEKRHDCGPRPKATHRTKTSEDVETSRGSRPSPSPRGYIKTAGLDPARRLRTNRRTRITPGPAPDRPRWRQRAFRHDSRRKRKLATPPPSHPYRAAPLGLNSPKMPSAYHSCAEPDHPCAGPQPGPPGAQDFCGRRRLLMPQHSPSHGGLTSGRHHRGAGSPCVSRGADLPINTSRDLQCLLRPRLTGP